MTEKPYACLMLPFPPSANHLFPGVRKRYASQRYKDWQKQALWEIKFQKCRLFFNQPVSVTLSFGRPDKRRRDIDNVIKPILDTLQKAKIIENDSLVHRLVAVWAHDVVGCRVEIELAGAHA